MVASFFQCISYLSFRARLKTAVGDFSRRPGPHCYHTATKTREGSILCIDSHRIFNAADKQCNFFLIPLSKLSGSDFTLTSISCPLVSGKKKMLIYFSKQFVFQICNSRRTYTVLKGGTSSKMVHHKNVSLVRLHF